MRQRAKPTLIPRVPAGLDGALSPLLPDEVVASFPEHRFFNMAQTNDYTVLLSARSATAVACRMLAALAR